MSSWTELFNNPDVMKTVAAFAGLGVVAYASAKDLRRQKARSQKRVTAEEVRRYFKAKTLDSTKRKSLQPANQRPIPTGWTDEDEKAWLEANKQPQRLAIDTKRPKSNAIPERGLNNEIGASEFFHKFYGSRLILDGYVIKGGMTNKLHTLEVTKGDRLFIDGNPVSIHPTELDKLKVGLKRIQSPSESED